MTWDIGTLTAAIFTIATLSSVFIKNNPAFEVVQPIFLGVAAGHAFVVNAVSYTHLAGLVDVQLLSLVV